MRDQLKHFPVNWIDGMKINKNHFIDQDNAFKASLHDASSLVLSSIRYGLLPSSAAGEDNCNVKISLDNQSTLRVSVISLQAITSGGIRIVLPALSTFSQVASDGTPATTFQFSSSSNETSWWVILTINPYEREPAGSPDTTENPPRFPYVLPTYTVEVVSESQYRQYANHPYSLTIGKVSVNGNEVKVEYDYIPPCFSVSAHPDLVALHGELDQFLAGMEIRCSQIVQKIFKKSQQNELSELVLFLCDRVILFLSQAITGLRSFLIHESPAILFANIASLSRLMKNTIDLRIGSGKDELMNYLSEWCELKQGELETMLGDIANLRYDNNDINQSISKVIRFAKVTSKLFETLSNLEFIGKRKESGIFVKEEVIQNQSSDSQQQNKGRRRFFG